mmetsp:Transcript_16793/g.33875  ORF Transcript_16793/g.33875 Transcript_16793/m.33875 type:complete len:216 (+) Transcript_16793:417-1064(+)
MTPSSSQTIRTITSLDGAKSARPPSVSSAPTSATVLWSSSGSDGSAAMRETITEPGSCSVDPGWRHVWRPWKTGASPFIAVSSRWSIRMPLARRRRRKVGASHRSSRLVAIDARRGAASCVGLEGQPTPHLAMAAVSRASKGVRMAARSAMLNVCGSPLHDPLCGSPLHGSVRAPCRMVVMRLNRGAAASSTRRRPPFVCARAARSDALPSQIVS